MIRRQVGDRRSRSLHVSLRWFMLGVTALVVVIYSLQLHGYFSEGLDQSLTLELRLIADEYQSQRAQDPDTPLPKGRFTRAFTDQRQVAEISDCFQVNQLQDGKLEHDFRRDPTTGKPSEALFLLPIRLDDGSRLFILRRLTPDLFTDEMKQEFDRMTLYQPGVTALVILALALIFVQIYIRRLDSRISELSEWSQGLSLDSAGDPPPSLGYRELDDVAERLFTAAVRVRQLLQREQDFLRHAGHELRTPIAVVRNTAELLDRQMEMARSQTLDPEPLRPPVARIRRAALNMQLMTETLLWLSREKKNALKSIDCVLADTVADLTKEHGYLLEGKSIEIDTEVVSREPTQVPRGPLRIVLANLIRNAFQHTQSGRVQLVCDHQRVVITNLDSGVCSHADSQEPSPDSYRLGLELCREISNVLGWSLQIEPRDDGFRVSFDVGSA